MPESHDPEVTQRPRRRRLVLPASAVVVVLLGLAATVFLKLYRPRPHPLPPSVLEGSVLKTDADPQKQQPIADVQVVATSGASTGEAKTDEIGFFHLVMRPGIATGAPIELRFRHPDYKPLDSEEISHGRILLARLIPLHQVNPVVPTEPVVNISNIVVRYTVRTTRTENTGSAVKTFQVVNTGNVACNESIPCSPDGKWKAAIGGISLDAGAGNQFENARVSCISGPCAFTRIESNSLSETGRKISISALGWSDTTTFLLEAEVVHPMVSDPSLHLYPVIFGQSLNFNLPPTAQGLCIQATVNKHSVIFPIGPDLCLSWADCTVSVGKDQTKSYRCELKPQYQFATTAQ